MKDLANKGHLGCSVKTLGVGVDPGKGAEHSKFPLIVTYLAEPANDLNSHQTIDRRMSSSSLYSLPLGCCIEELLSWFDLLIN